MKKVYLTEEFFRKNFTNTGMDAKEWSTYWLANWSGSNYYKREHEYWFWVSRCAHLEEEINTKWALTHPNDLIRHDAQSWSKL